LSTTDLGRAVLTTSGEDVALDVIIVADAAERGGAVLGRPLLPVIGIVLIVVSDRRRAVARQAPVPQSEGQACGSPAGGFG